MLPPTEEGLRIDWTYSGFTMRGWFDGPLVANVFSEGELGFVFRVEVDGGESIPQRIGLGEKTVTLATLEKGYHTVTVRKVTEGSTSRVILRSLSFKGMLDEPPKAPELKIEIIGASTSCGVGSYPEAVTNWDYLTHCDSYYAYTTMVAREMEAELNFVSVSGWGLVYGSGSADKKIPSIYSLTSYVSDRETKWDFDSWQADVVIITLGGNDRSAPAMLKQSYSYHALNFLKTVREAYPHAYLLWHYGDAGEELVPHIQAAVSQMNDERVAYLGRPRNSSGGWSHADYQTHVTYAQDVLAHLTPILTSVTD
ncbi:MAG: hypothetical protein E7618_04385 [Ruminococcaceae bacterium]|nr:hypothetical protein [Oscillospiraceae bacterium]